MNVLVKEAGKRWRVEVIDGSLKSMQELVGGYIEVAYHTENGDVLICDEEGALKIRPAQLVSIPEGDLFLFGTVFLCGVSGEDFSDVSGETVHDIAEIEDDHELLVEYMKLFGMSPL